MQLTFFRIQVLAISISWPPIQDPSNQSMTVVLLSLTPVCIKRAFYVEPGAHLMGSWSNATIWKIQHGVQQRFVITKQWRRLDAHHCYRFLFFNIGRFHTRRCTNCLDRQKVKYENVVSYFRIHLMGSCLYIFLSSQNPFFSFVSSRNTPPQVKGRSIATGSREDSFEHMKYILFWRLLTCITIKKKSPKGSCYPYLLIDAENKSPFRKTNRLPSASRAQYKQRL